MTPRSTKGGHQQSILNHFVLRTIKTKPPDKGEGSLKQQPIEIIESKIDKSIINTSSSTSNSITGVKQQPQKTIINLVDDTKKRSRSSLSHTTTTTTTTNDSSTNTNSNTKTHHRTKKQKQQQNAEHSLKCRALPVSDNKRRFILPSSSSLSSKGKLSSKKKKKKNNNTKIPTPPLPTTTTTTTTATPTVTKCSFCNCTPAAISIKPKPSKGNPLHKPSPRPQPPPQLFCLLHYYTTRACRTDPSRVTPYGDGTEYTHQLEGVQTLFCESFMELQTEIAEESARSFRRTCKDPLSILTSLTSSSNNKHKRRGNGGIRRKRVTNEEEENEGGYLPQVQSRERSLMEQQQQRIEHAAVQGMTNATDEIDSNSTTPSNTDEGRTSTSNPTRKRTVTATVPNIYKRRRAGGNIWKDVLSGNSKGGKATSTATTKKQQPPGNNDWSCAVTCGGCQGTNVEVLGSIVRRNNDVGKADIWGMARENDVSTRYECSTCGLKWNEAD